MQQFFAVHQQAASDCPEDKPEWSLSHAPRQSTTTLSYPNPWIMTQQPEDPARSNSFYPSAQFPSSQIMAGQYSYPPPEGQVCSPAGSNMPLPPLSLPPIRSIDGIAQPQQQQQQGQQGQQNVQNATGSAMAPAMGQYYGQTQPFPPNADPNAPQRWPLPPDGRVMSGGRHKKEIKRRTKTGCLTCRKRRIKCDEAHPSCRNCQKSKRDCLGYDPIFKSQPGPTAIQPAASGAPTPLHSDSANTSPYPPPPPQGYLHADPQAYGPARTHSENSTTGPYDYGSTIDPALGGGDSAQMQDDKGLLETGSPYPQGAPNQPGHPVKRTKIEELLCLKGYNPPPPAPSTALSAATKDEIQKIWLAVYASGIDKFLETRWFGMRGLTHLMENSRLCSQFAAVINRFTSYPDPNDPNNCHYFYTTQSLEATVVWAMMGMCRQVTSRSKTEGAGIDELDIKEGVEEAAKRLETFEVLVTGEYLDAESAAPSSDPESNGTALDHQLKTRERKFWSLVHKFLTIRDDEASSAKEIDDTLAACRLLLDSRENRDVIYSIMIARHIGARMAEFPNNLQQPESNDEADNRNKLVVAKKFIEYQGTRGTNQVVQRLCGMAVRSWTLKR